MSLKIWITGNGNINNQGTLGELTQVTAPTYVDGKMGKAVTNYQLKTDATQNLEVLNNKEFSYCAWLYPNDDTGTSGVGWIFGNSGSNVDAPASARRYSIYNGSTINDIEMSTFLTNTTAQKGFISLKGILPSYTWTHVAFSYKNPNLTVYVNGEVAGTATFNTTTTKYGYATSIANISSRMYQNDLRVYDHALSKKEVHEIYKSLILHYPLNNPFGNPNLVANTFDWDGANIASGSNITNESYHGFRVLNAAMLASSSNGYRDACRFSVGAEPSTTYTLSFYYKGPDFESYFYPSMVESGENDSGYTTTRVDGLILSNGSATWKKYTISWTTLSTVTSGTSGTVSPIRIHKGTADKHGYICGIKFEKGDTATPWCPNSADEEYSLLGLDSKEIADCSGYGNDGISTTSEFVSSDLEGNHHYYTGLYMNNTDYIHCGLGAKVTDEITVSIWAHSDDWNAGDARLFDCGASSYGWSIESLNSTLKIVFRRKEGNHFANFSTSLELLSAGWHMFTFTFDGFVLKAYLDGELDGSNDISPTTKIPIPYVETCPILIHADAGTNETTPFKADFIPIIASDFRIYATALTAEDIKELYQTPFSIDKNGNVFGYNFMEV